MENQNEMLLKKIVNAKPSAVANIFGGEDFRDIRGKVDFYQFDEGCVLVCFVSNLPKTNINIFGFHIHQKGECEGDFTSSGGHYGEGPHPCHKGDLPCLFSNDGNAFMVVFTDRFKVSEVIDKSMIIHHDPDDFTTQPSGNSGSRIACGIIEKTKVLSL